MSIIRKTAAYILLISIYGFTYLIALLGSIIPHRSWMPTGRIMVTGTFHNPNWYLSHVIPLTRSGFREVILVVDEPQLPLEKVRFVCPPKWVSRLLSRAGAKTIWMTIAGFRYQPDIYMGYHLAPGACSALVAGKLWGRPSCYQMTSGPVGIIGGGVDAIDSVGGLLGHPSKLIEAMAIKVASKFELVVVRGKRARGFLAAHDIKDTVAIITGSVNACPQIPQIDRVIHLVFVGRLSLIKQVHQFIEIIGAVRHIMPNVRAAIVGDGPLMTDLQTYAEKLGLTNNIEFLGKRKDVESIIACSKIFVLTSKSEGLSIAMAEAMVAGAVPVVADVGDLSDLVIDGVNGFLVEPNCIDEYTTKIMFLLQDPSLLEKYSLRAVETARTHCDIAVVSKKWQQNLQNVVLQTSGLNTE
ncbi:MAG: glycosyltransferase family 4 protein [Planctomycetes bacterium]|nr:glycosyltransferase family 4 protein [Planctomycetota bacterium]